MRWSNMFNHIRNVVIMKYHIAVLETEFNGAAIRLTDRESLVNEVEGQLKKLAITASNRKDHVFLSINTNRQGFISKENLRALVSHHHLPADPDIIDGVSLLPHTPHSIQALWSEEGSNSCLQTALSLIVTCNSTDTKHV